MESAPFLVIFVLQISKSSLVEPSSLCSNISFTVKTEHEEAEMMHPKSLHLYGLLFMVLVDTLHGTKIES